MTLLTVDEYTGLHADHGLDDESLQLLLDFAEAEIDRYAGPTSTVTEVYEGGGRLLALKRRAASIVSITETTYPSYVVDDLATDDWYARPDGYVVERIGGGTVSRYHWRDRVTVTYVPEDDRDIRKGVQADLVALATNYQPGLTSETVGAWTTQVASNSVWNESTQRVSILSRLTEGGRMAVV